MLGIVGVEKFFTRVQSVSRYYAMESSGTLYAELERYTTCKRYLILRKKCNFNFYELQVFYHILFVLSTDFFLLSSFAILLKSEFEFLCKIWCMKLKRPIYRQRVYSVFQYTPIIVGTVYSFISIIMP